MIIMMRDLIDFCIFIVSKIAVLLFGSDLGGYSYGDFLVAVLVVSVVRPPRASKRSGGSK